MEYQYQLHFFINSLKCNLKAKTKIYKEIHAGLELEWSVYNKYYKS